MKRAEILRVVCPTCGAKAKKPCIRIMGADKGTTLIVPHVMREKRAERLAGLKDCPHCHGTGKVRA